MTEERDSTRKERQYEEERQQERQRLLNEAEGAQFLGVRPQTLRVWRHHRRGPPFLRLGDHGRIRYVLADLEKYIQRCRVDPTKKNRTRQRPAAA
jgi:hypothetical protein